MDRYTFQGDRYREKGAKVKGYKFKVEFVIWGKDTQLKAKEKLENFLLESGTEEGFNIKAPKFVGILTVWPK